MSGGMRTLIIGYNDRWRRLRRLFHQLLSNKACAAYEPIQVSSAVRAGLFLFDRHFSIDSTMQEYEARRLIQDIYLDPERHQEHAKRYAASTITTITFSRPLASYSDPTVISVNTCLGRLGDAIAPGAYLVDAFPLLRFWPEWGMKNGGWKKQGREWHEEERKLFRGMVDEVKAGEVRIHTLESPSNYCSTHSRPALMKILSRRDFHHRLPRTLSIINRTIT